MIRGRKSAQKEVFFDCEFFVNGALRVLRFADLIRHNN